MRTIFLGTTAFFAFCLLAARAHAADYFVAPDGSDESGAGTLQRPWKSIQKGLAAALPGDRVVLRGGEYRLPGCEGTIHFPRAGEPDKPITLTACEEEYVALLGSVRLTDWQPHQDRIFRCPAPAKIICGLFEDAVRLNHPRSTGTRENPPVSALQGPGQWTVADGWVYLWCREGDNPAQHRIEASQSVVVAADKPWVRVEKLHIFFGQPMGLNLRADHVVADGVEVAHVSNSVDNAYGAYFLSCSNSRLCNSTIHDSYYWGDHGSNSHVVSCIDAGDHGPNFVENCDIFDGGLGVGTKGAVREMLVLGNRIRDVQRGVLVSGERVSGPGAGKTDRGHYLVYGNVFRDCAHGVFFYSGKSHQSRVYNNLFQRCGRAIHIWDYEGISEKTELANNVFLQCETAIFCLAGRVGKPTLARCHDAGLRSHHNLFFDNRVDWRNPLDWGRSFDQTFQQVQAYGDYGWETGSVGGDPLVDDQGRSAEGSPALGKGAAVELPSPLSKPEVWNIGPGPSATTRRPRGLALTIAGCPTSVAAGDTLALRASLTNESPDESIRLGGDCIVTFHFRNANVWHFDKQEIHRTRVELPDRALAPGESLELAALPGWTNPTNGKQGEPFHLRDDKEWRSGWRLSASARMVRRGDATATATQRLEPLLRSKEMLLVKTQ